MNDRLIILNELAQRLRPLQEGAAWFHGQHETEQQETLQLLAFLCEQAGAALTDGPAAIARAELRPTHTPAVLLARGDHLQSQLRKIVRLPADERAKSFLLLTALFAVADDRRRALYCGDDCSHSWHHPTERAGGTG